MIRRFILWLPLAFVAGGIVGAWGPSEELRALRERPARKRVEQGKDAGFGAFARMVNIPDVAKRRRPARAAAANVSAATNASVQTAAAPAAEGRPAATNASAAKAARPVRRMDPEDLRARIDEAAELWRTRSDLVRASAVKKLGLDAAGEDRFDAALAGMNEELRASMQAIADALAAEEEMTPELGVRLMGDLSTTVAETYDRIGETVDADRRGEVSKLQLFELIDPSVAEPLIEVQGKLDAFPAGRARR